MAHQPFDLTSSVCKSFPRSPAVVIVDDSRAARMEMCTFRRLCAVPLLYLTLTQCDVCYMLLFPAVLTLYSAMILHSYFAVLISSGIQVLALAWYAMSYVPGGTAGMQST